MLISAAVKSNASALLFSLAAAVLFLLYEYGERLAEHDVFMGILVGVLILTLGCAFAFPLVFIITLLVEGIKLIRREGLKPSNFLTLLFAVFLYLYLAVWPVIGDLKKGGFGTRVYAFISLFAFYVLLLMTVYLLSAALNLFHLKKNRRADYIIVLGAGVIGTRVTPLLGARIDRGIQLLGSNPDAVLIMSGGQGKGEDIAEGEAMARYAREKGVSAEKIIVEGKSKSTEENLMFSRELMDKGNPKIVIVTTSYHVFRALILAKRQGMKCEGFGSKTKWYFTLNALIREFMGYLCLTWKRHVFMAVLICLAVVVL